MGIEPNLNRIPFNATKNSQQHWTNRSWYYENTPTFFPDPYSAGMHEELHRAIKNDIGKIQGPWQGSAEDLFNASSRNLDSVSHIRGDLKIPSTGEILARNVTPKEAHSKLLEWFNNKQTCKASGGRCG